MNNDHCVYRALLGSDTVIYYGLTSRPDDRFLEHERAAQRLCQFSAKELTMALALRREELSFEIVKKDMQRREAQELERLLIHETKPLGNETFARKR